MVKMIKVIKKDNLIIIKGHAGSGEYGKDIVCAACSSIIYTTINALKRINEKSIEVIDKKDMQIKIIGNDEITNILINNMLDLLSSLESQYPKNIIVKEN